MSSIQQTIWCLELKLQLFSNFLVPYTFPCKVLVCFLSCGILFLATGNPNVTNSLGSIPVQICCLSSRYPVKRTQYMDHKQNTFPQDPCITNFWIASNRKFWSSYRFKTIHTSDYTQSIRNKPGWHRRSPWLITKWTLCQLCHITQRCQKTGKWQNWILTSCIFTFWVKYKSLQFRS